MCGIAGIFSNQKTVERSVLERMNAQIIHRGPDADGFYFSPAGPGPHAGLAMRRLKVIDLSTGNQPIQDGSGRWWIIFNGEIYNYRELRSALEKKGHTFTTHSDTEVILHQYMEQKENCVHSLIGMFAFAVFDAQERSLFIARDRLGIKPLFYHESSEGVLFASEIKSLLEHPSVERRVDPQAVSHYLSMNYLPSPWTPVAGIKQLPAGSWMKLQSGRVEIRQYWDVPMGEIIEASEEEACKEIERLLHQSMERRLIADVPIGAFLSGGMDSSTLVYLMKEQKHGTIKTFSAGFDAPGYDETPFAREIASKFGTDHHEISCRPEDVAEILPRIAWHADNLLADQAALPLYLVSKLAKKHVTVCLSGDGGDEVFIGYPTFHADRYHAIYSGLPAFVRKTVIEPLVRSMPSSGGKLSFDYKAKKFIEAAGFTNERAHYWWRTIYNDGEKTALLRPEIAKQVRLDAYPLYGNYIENPKGDFTERALYADLKVWLNGNNLYKVDTMTMAHGLEARVPFLDHQLVEYLSMLPPELKFKGRVLKYLLKKIMRHKLPDIIFNRKKAGWHTPIALWFRGPLKNYLQTELLGRQSRLQAWVEPSAVRRLLEEHAAGRHNHSFKIWGLLIFEHWLRAFNPLENKGLGA